MKTNFWHLIVLAFILLGGVVTFIYARGDRTIQLLVGVVTCLAYVAWGIIFHALQKTIHPKVVVEYLLVGAIAIVLIMTVIGS